MTYKGKPPSVRGSDTSRAAAESMTTSAPTLRTKVLRLIIAAGPRGLTDDEIEVVTGMRHQTASARRRELVLGGKVQDSGGRRRTRSGRGATVWVYVEPKPTQLSLLDDWPEWPDAKYRGANEE